jgi:hypothetical protein
MCLPTKTDQPSTPPAGSGTRSLLGMGGLMLLACLGGPALPHGSRPASRRLSCSRSACSRMKVRQPAQMRRRVTAAGMTVHAPDFNRIRRPADTVSCTGVPGHRKPERSENLDRNGGFAIPY